MSLSKPTEDSDEQSASHILAREDDNDCVTKSIVLLSSSYNSWKIVSKDLSRPKYIAFLTLETSRKDFAHICSNVKNHISS